VKTLKKYVKRAHRDAKTRLGKLLNNRLDPAQNTTGTGPAECYPQAVSWVDDAGFQLATSAVPADWNERLIRDLDFVLDVGTATVTTESYL
jgi:hypothetical protein